MGPLRTVAMSQRACANPTDLESGRTSFTVASARASARFTSKLRGMQVRTKVMMVK